MMLAIKEAVTDMSPYVRKTAANAITKLYRYIIKNKTCFVFDSLVFIQVNNKINEMTI